MPLCKKSRQSKCTCHDELKYYNDDPSLGCHKGRDTFVLQKEYRLYKQAGLDLFSLPPDDDLFKSSDNNKDNRGKNGKQEGEIKEDFYSAASPDSDKSTDNGGKNEMNNRAHPEAVNKRQKQQSKVQVERRTQPRRTCKV